MKQPTVQPNPDRDDPFHDRVPLPEPQIDPPHPGTTPAEDGDDLDPMDKALADSFPASDPPAVPQTIGGPSNTDADAAKEQAARPQ